MWREQEKREPGRPVALCLDFASKPRIALGGDPVGHPMLFGRNRHVDRTELSAKLAVVEHDSAVDEREQGMVLAHADVKSWLEIGPALTHEDVAGDGFLPAELLD